MMFHDWSDIQLIRRNCIGTVFPLKGEDGGHLPFLVNSVERNGTFFGKVFTGKKIYKTSAKEDQLSIDKIRLGYTNVRGGANYLMRKPLRDWRQGLRANNVVGLPRTLDDNTLVSLYLPISGNYPGFEEAKYIMNVFGSSAVAFDRNFCINSNGLLYHKGTCVGNYLTGYRSEYESISLLPSYHYLREAIKHAMGDREYYIQDLGEEELEVDVEELEVDEPEF